MISNNKAKKGSSIYLRAVVLTTDSYIQNTKFENNDSDQQEAERGTVYISFDDGIMDISDNTFTNNKGIESCISISTNANTDLDSYTLIKNNTFENNEGIVIGIIENIFISQVRLELNKFIHNYGQALVIRYGNVAD